jgi:general secretion pathway protein K
MSRQGVSSGFALLLVLWTLVVLSVVALTLAASVGTEVRASQGSWNDLQAERLAKSGHEIAAYLETRAIGTAAEDFTGVPVQPLVLGLKYRVAFDIGVVDIVLEGENGKFDFAAADEDDVSTFLNAWTGDSNRSREIAASIADWIDTNDDPRLFGAESVWYRSRGYRPRNGSLGAADLFLVKGMTREDFVPAIINFQDRPAVRTSLVRVISAMPAGRQVNPNYALPIVLSSLPGMTPQTLDRILEARQRSIFTSVQDFQNRLGLSADSTLLTRFTFGRGNAPAILALARLNNSSVVRTERRTRTQVIDRRRGVPVRFVSLIERGVPFE